MKEWGEFMYRGTVPGLSRVATVTATGALAGCVILQIWSLLCQVREHLGAVQSGRPVELWVTALYLALVILFSWCAARGESRAYRAAALSAAALQLFAAAACAVLACAQPAAGGTELARTALGLLLLELVVVPPALQGRRILPDGPDQVQLRVLHQLVLLAALIGRRSQGLRLLPQAVHLEAGLLAAALVGLAGCQVLLPHPRQGLLLLLVKDAAGPPAQQDGGQGHT